jgi:methyltransferase (TIGR00027 family)
MKAEASKTAKLVAAYRARATAKGYISDPWAAQLAGDEGARFTEIYDRVFPPGELWLAVRTWFLDREVRYYTQTCKFPQVVILGAGLDTRAARLATPGVRFFEVDHPATQAHKVESVRALPGYPADAATYVACNFEHDDYLDRLAASGFRTDAPAIFIWEGVTYYLTEPAVRATLRRMASGCEKTSVIVFDYVMRKLVEGQRVTQQDKDLLALLASISEPFHFGINDVLPMLFEEGFRHVRTVSFDEACLTMTGTYERGRQMRFQLFALASPTPPPVTTQNHC